METVVHIGEVKLGLQGHTMSALLGSCIGIALLDRTNARCTLSHSLLPIAPMNEANDSGRWVDQAVRYALTLMDSYPLRDAQIEAVVAGGGQMMHTPHNSKFKVGAANAEAAREVLDRYNITISNLDILGDQGRRMTLEVDSLKVIIERIPRLRTKRKQHG